MVWQYASTVSTYFVTLELSASASSAASAAPFVGHFNDGISW
jgi:hypothetical protein